ncbi:tRNA (adenosine(37)-N6)-threonylcarbamoyltransferase complex ATPase subunit type 1 TsaE [Thiomonas sp. FB-Cd]|uniref:tRNA (adenosine(37)-N6)-threonylcarbamoyltransferase complex ATPase subunit type 1 TsaE n=1 Tax=Thiomonas sp. FB-Cd TaxID=1158292 RepID=UPI0004DEE059
MTLSLHCDSEHDMSVLGAKLAQALLHLQLPGLLITLRGDLGAGKTTLVRAILRGLGVTDRIKSPSYALVEPYAIDRKSLQLKGTLQTHAYHIDLYRFSQPEEWDEAGLRELLDGHSFCLVEWPERAPALLPRADLEILLIPVPSGRDVQLRSGSPVGAALLNQLVLAQART